MLRPPRHPGLWTAWTSVARPRCPQPQQPHPSLDSLHPSSCSSRFPSRQCRVHRNRVQLIAKELQQIERIFSEIETLLCQGDAQCAFCRTFILGLSADGYDGRDQNLQVAERYQVSEVAIIEKLDETAAFPERHDRNAGRQRFHDHRRIGIFARREQQDVGGGEIITHIRSLPDEVEVPDTRPLDVARQPGSNGRVQRADPYELRRKRMIFQREGCSYEQIDPFAQITVADADDDPALGGQYEFGGDAIARRGRVCDFAVEALSTNERTLRRHGETLAEPAASHRGTEDDAVGAAGDVPASLLQTIFLD